MLQDDPLVQCASIMDALGLPYCLIGGFAVASYGVPRQTGDVDVLVIIDGDSREVVDRLTEKGFKVTLNRADLLDPMGDVISIVATRFPIQLIKAKYQYEIDAVINAITISYEDQALRLITKEDLVLLKLRAGSPLDLSDAEFILEMQGQGMDLESLKKKAKVIRVDRRLNGILKRLKNPEA